MGGKVRAAAHGNGETLQQRARHIEANDAAADWVMSRRSIEQGGSHNPDMMQDEFLESFLKEYDSGSLVKPELASQDLVEKFKEWQAKYPQDRYKWHEHCNPKAGGTHTGDQRRLPASFVQAFLDKHP